MNIGLRTACWMKHGAPAPAYGGLCFTAEAANSSVQLTAVGGGAPTVSLIKSTDGTNWSPYAVGDVISLPNIGDMVYLAAGEGGNTRFGNSARYYHMFVMSGEIAASGDITSLLEFNLTNTLKASYTFYRLFGNCVSLKTIPELPISELSFSYCYNYMFYGCTGITSAELKATDIKATGSCANMFNGCSNLSSVKVSFSNAWSNCTSNWLNNVAAKGTFYKPAELPEEYGSNKIPSGWSVVNI